MFAWLSQLSSRIMAPKQRPAAKGRCRESSISGSASGAVSGMRRLGMPLRQRTLLVTSVAAALSGATCAAACAAAAASAAAPKCKSSRAHRQRQADKIRPCRQDKRQRHRIKSKSARDAETQTEQSNLRVVVEQELWVVQGLARLLAKTPLWDELRTCGERLAQAMVLHDGDTARRAAAQG